jgi:hypothetical protein
MYRFANISSKIDSLATLKCNRYDQHGIASFGDKISFLTWYARAKLTPTLTLHWISGLGKKPSKSLRIDCWLHWDLLWLYMH